MEPVEITIKGAREHNLRGVNLTLPRNKLICLTGVSGSGKSSLAFDTLYAEGQRRYVESLSAYARQFISQLAKPAVDQITGLSPAIAIQQKTGGWNPRSTVGTVTGIMDFLRVLWAGIGVQHCPACGRSVQAMSKEQMIARALSLPEGARAMVLAPVVRGQKGTFADLFADLLRRGFLRVRADGAVYELTDPPKLAKNNKHDVAVVIDRLVIGPAARNRIAEAIATALATGDGTVEITPASSPASSPQPPSPVFDPLVLSQTAHCPEHLDQAFAPISVQLLSFNSPQGACPECDGLGLLQDFDEKLLVPDPSKPFCAPAVVAMRNEPGRWKRHIYQGVADALGFNLDLPWKELPLSARRALLYGTGERRIPFTWKARGGRVHRYYDHYAGVITDLKERLAAAQSPMVQDWYRQFMRTSDCASCRGGRLNPQAANIRVGGKTLPEISHVSVAEAAAWFRGLPERLTPVEKKIAEDALKEISARLQFLLNVGLDYLSLDRSATSLSGGESQRIRLAGQIGSGLVGVIYVLDEPSIGLHARDNARMLAALRELADRGNTVIVVEHDEETMRAADQIVDFGPGAGHRGGNVVSQGHWQWVAADVNSLTGAYLAGKRTIEVPAHRRPVGPVASAIKPAKRKRNRKADKGL